MEGFIRESLPMRVVFGEGVFAELGNEIQRLGAIQPFLISHGSGQLTDLACSLFPRWAGVWTDVRQHVPTELADRCCQAITDAGADLLVAVGGGSATGLAKAVAHRSGLKILCVPTTYAGSEMTPIWGQTDGRSKITARHPGVLPAAVIYDPTLVFGLRRQVVAASGMNALAHCVEALYAPQADPLTSLMATEGARLLFEYLPAAVNGPAGIGLSEIMWASCLAGSVLGTVGGSLHHSLCHLLGGLHDLPHAETHAVVLPHVLSYLMDDVKLQLRPLAETLGVRVELVPGSVWDLAVSLGAPTGLGDLGITKADVDEIVQQLMERNPPSPRPLVVGEATDLVHCLVDGARPPS